MAAADFCFLQGFAHTMEEIRRDQEVDPIAVTMIVLAAAKALRAGPADHPQEQTP